MHTAMTKRAARSSVQWVHEVKVDGSVTFRTGRSGTRLIADWPGSGRLTCAPDGGGATFTATAGLSPGALGKLQRGQVRALLHDLAGGLALHASAVAIHGRAVVFLGANGAGKSTAAAEMCLRHGAETLADDVALLDVREGCAYVLPSEDEHWLTRDSRQALGVASKRGGSASDKRAVRAKSVAHEPCRLCLVIALRFDSAIGTAELRSVRGGDGARQLLEAVLRFDVENGAARRRELEQVTTVYNGAPFLEVVRPSEKPPGVAAWVIDALEGGAS